MQAGVDGAFESDEAVDWHDPGNGTIAFTLTDSLWSALQGRDSQSPGYRCGLQQQTMRGDLVLVE